MSSLVFADDVNYRVAMELARTPFTRTPFTRPPHASPPGRKVLAPPPLGNLPDSTMLAVASVPGKVPEEWRPAGPLWMAWPHAAGADLAVEMTAAQLRDRLTAMDGNHG